MFLILLTVSATIFAGASLYISLQAIKKTKKRGQTPFNIVNLNHYDQSHHTNVFDSHNQSNSYIENSNNDSSTSHSKHDFSA